MPGYGGKGTGGRSGKHNRAQTRTRSGHRGCSLHCRTLRLSATSGAFRHGLGGGNFWRRGERASRVPARGATRRCPCECVRHACAARVPRACARARAARRRAAPHVRFVWPRLRARARPQPRHVPVRLRARGRGVPCGAWGGRRARTVRAAGCEKAEEGAPAAASTAVLSLCRRVGVTTRAAQCRIDAGFRGSNRGPRKCDDPFSEVDMMRRLNDPDWRGVAGFGSILWCVRVVRASVREVVVR